MKSSYTAKTKLAILLPLALAALGVQGCKWEDSEDERYVNGSEVSKCDFDLLSLGNGKYIKRNGEGFICGDYNSLVLNDTASSTERCSENEIALAKEAMEYGICPRSAFKCVPRLIVNKSEGSEKLINGEDMCSECDKGQVSCGGECVNLNSDSDNCGGCGNKCNYNERGETCINGKCDPNCNLTNNKICFENNKPQCVDTQNNPKHCGACNHDCSTEEGSPDICSEGACRSSNTVELRQCDSTNKDIYSCYQIEGADKLISADDYANDHSNHYIITNSEEPVCISASDETTCGATGCNRDSFKPCPKNYICVKDDNSNYSCKCPAGSVEITDPSGSTLCANPSDEEHCGISQSNPEGENCAKDEHKKCNGIKCVCEPGRVDCNGLCINPLLDNNYCGPDKQCNQWSVCNSQQKCESGVCTCDSPYINCDGTCIDPNNSKPYCGAKGLCSSDDVNSTNFKGIDCGSAKCVINNSTPECKCSHEDSYFDVVTKKCVSRISADSCGSEHVDCRGKYHPDAKCNSKGNCVCPEPLIRLDDGIYLEKYEKKKAEEGFVEPSSLCVDIQFYNRFCGDNLITCGDNQMCAGGKCEDIDETLCSSRGSGKTILCDNRCINLEENHMENCNKCNSDWCSTELLVRTAGCNSKIGFGVNNCAQCLYNDNRIKGLKCDDMYDACVDNNCVCSSGKIELTVKDGDGGNMCVDTKLYRIEICSGNTCPNGFECSDGWGDCLDGTNTSSASGVADGRIGADGCETNIHEGKTKDNTIENCGACNSICSPSNVDYPKCSNGVCGYNQCLEGYDNCSGNSAEGCLTNLINDENNCGVCGKVCSEGDCNNGNCCWNNKIYSTEELTQDDCCPGTKLYKACDKNIFHQTRYTCAKEKPTVETNGWCDWSEI